MNIGGALQKLAGVGASEGKIFKDGVLKAA